MKHNNYQPHLSHVDASSLLFPRSWSNAQEARKDYAQLPLDFLKELREQESSVSKLEVHGKSCEDFSILKLGHVAA